MKYIRTKDSVYQIKEPNKKTNITVCTNHGWVFKEDIIKQADSIEKLCDEFVFSKNGYNYCYQKVGFNERGLYLKCTNCYPNEVLRPTLRPQIAIYGAIWTDKGLIYVAKMKGVSPNGEIDWELL